MRLRLRRPIQALDAVYARRAVSQVQIDAFRQALARLFSRIDEHESDEYQKTIVGSLFREAFENQAGLPLAIDTHDAVDLVIRQAPVGSVDDSLSPGALIETRRVFAADMMTMLKNNVRALHELILYAFENSQRAQPLGIRQFVITDAYNWFIFNQTDFQAIFLDNARLIRAYQLSQQPAKGPAFFYVEAAKILRDLDQDVPVTYLNLREAADWLTLPPAAGNALLMPVYKLLSPEHLLGQPAATDEASVCQRFYGDLLHLLGLGEIRRGRSRPALIQRLPEADRQPDSLLEQIIHQLQLRNALARLPNRLLYGSNEDEQLVKLGLILCVTWIGRLLFIKLFEAQLAHYQSIEERSEDLPSITQSIQSFTDLNELFFDIFPVPFAQRTQDQQHRFGAFPWLSVDLFKPTDIEQHTITIADLPDASALAHLLAVLDAYAFEADARPAVQLDTRPLLTTTDIGLVLDRVVNGLAGAAPVPPLVTSWTVREATHRAALTRFNAHYGWHCPNVTELSETLRLVSVADTNAVFDSLRIVDPAVSSGSFLVVALNELIVLKADLGILADQQNRPLAQYTISLVGQDLFITHEDGEPFHYKPLPLSPQHQPPSPEGQRVQEIIFRTKVAVLTNCLFGTDTDPVAVFTTQLRLWFDLLKNLYHVGQIPNRIGQKNAGGNHPAKSEFPILPAFPALTTIRQGDPLVSRYGPAFQVDTLRKRSTQEQFQSMLTQYRTDALTYKHEPSHEVRDRLRAFQTFVDQVFQNGQPAYATIRQLETKLSQAALTFDFADQTEKTQLLAQKLAAAQQRFSIHQRLFNQAIDWRFTFPDVVGPDGRYVGFDVVLGSLLRQRVPSRGDYGSMLKKSFPNTFGSTVERYVLFVELGMQLLRSNGQLAFVLPDRWLQTRQGLTLRRWLRTKALDWLIRFSDESGQGRRTTQATILIGRNQPAIDSVRTAQFIVQNELTLTDYLDSNAVGVASDSLPDTAWTGFGAL